MNRNVLFWMIITVAYTMGIIWEVCGIDTFMIIRYCKSSISELLIFHTSSYRRHFRVANIRAHTG